MAIVADQAVVVLVAVFAKIQDIYSMVLPSVSIVLVLNINRLGGDLDSPHKARKGLG